ncbi:MAG: methylenetetrahydrofolate--tRNA-(uracil(54)-C(5))-methyltransferase (FADH(2)-oxidizing) TrmFO [Erysipelotrichaceae bacterium]|jgi:methylenetetrahydrofolate--tRNA-(uracil-5-)-methyltransferase|nr:methylenetetrahydrofolate--tRNA-(uracil(54)-C(5))-methyltransferase (FADH(2)-oxidizing) TrmFO [Erysipelotrichaceae bacterium]
MKVTVVGAGLAGSEAIWQLAKRGIHVDVFEMRPKRKAPAFVSGDFAELVCSNSLRSDAKDTAVGVLKEEMRLLDSLVIRIAQETRIPAGSALAVDRVAFARKITETIEALDNVTIHREEVTEIPDTPCIIATGPLTSDALFIKLQGLIGTQSLYFYDAIAPIIDKSTIDMTKVTRASRYDVGEDYLNCPLNKEEFERFYDFLIQAELAPLHDFEEQIFFEGCMPIEVLAKRGPKTLLFGPMKPVGLSPEPYAVVQLRQDDAADTLVNMVGFQTRLSWPAQREMLKFIPGLKSAQIARYGVCHRNTYLNSPLFLDKHYQFKKIPGLYFAGQMTGVEGYVESSASGLIAGLSLARALLDQDPLPLDNTTVIGALSTHISQGNPKHFVPYNANFGLMRCQSEVKPSARRTALAAQAIANIETLVKSL